MESKVAYVPSPDPKGLNFELYSVDNPDEPKPLTFESMAAVIEYFGHGEYAYGDEALISGDGVQKLRPADLSTKMALASYAGSREKLGPGGSAILYALGLKTETGPVDANAKRIDDELKLGQSMTVSMKPEKVNGHSVFFYHYWQNDLYDNLLDEWLPHKEMLERRGLEQGALQYKNVVVMADPERQLVALIDLTGKAENYAHLYEGRELTKGPIIKSYPFTYGDPMADPGLDLLMAGPKEALDTFVQRIEYSGDRGGPHDELDEGSTNTHDSRWGGYCNAKDGVLAIDLDVRAALHKTQPTVFFYPNSHEKLEVFKVNREVLDALGALDAVYYTSGDIDDNTVFRLDEGAFVAGHGTREWKGDMRVIPPEEMKLYHRAKGDDADYNPPF